MKNPEQLKTNLLLPNLLLSLLILLLLTPSTQSTTQTEIRIPVRLYDSFFHPITKTTTNAPRYLVGSLGDHAATFHNLFTFDLGNPGETILTTSGCYGCDVILNGTEIGCPSVIPTCEDEPCWKSDPATPVPLYSIRFTNEACPPDVSPAGMLEEVPICTACFDSGNHSRFFAMSFSSIPYSFVDEEGGVVHHLPYPFYFGALVRTVPVQDRIWSNVGIGYNSSFFRQMNVDVFGLHLKNHEDAAVMFHPDPGRYDRLPFVRYEIERHRFIGVDSMVVGDKRVDISDFKFFMDTGNDGISIGDPTLKQYIQECTGGKWLPDTTSDPASYGEERLYLPSPDKPDLTLVLPSENESIQVTVRLWLLPPSDREWIPTVFVSYTKNVLGLPFLSSADFVFDEVQRKLYVDVGVGVGVDVEIM